MAETRQGAALRVEVLGPLRVVVDGEPVEVPGPKRRAALALLALAEGRTVSVNRLVDALWPAEMPDSGRQAVHTHVSRLRAHLGPAASRLQTRHDGYRLDLATDELDLAQARTLLATARAAPADALAVLRKAHGLWRGPVLADLTDSEPIAVAVVGCDAGRGGAGHRLLRRPRPGAGAARARTCRRGVTLDAAWSEYVAGEIESIAGHAEPAERHYRRAVDLAHRSGATFLVGVATVGLLTVLTDAGRIADALRGYRDVVDYFARTGNWPHLWPALRNLADLLRRIGDPDPAAVLDAAADQAPDAPAVDRGERRLAPPTAAVSRDEVLRIARDAIERHLSR